MSKNIVHPTEVDYFIQSIRPFRIDEIGRDAWLDQHEILLKLNQQAILEVKSYQEELIKEQLIINNKLPILIHEIYSIVIWRLKILTKLLEIDGNPQATFFLYSVLFHEAVAVSLLEICLYHESACESLCESSLDLIDYCIQNLTQLIGLINSCNGEYNDDADEDLGSKERIKDVLNDSSAKEFESQKCNLFYRIGLRCLTILSYLVDKIPNLPFSAIIRLVQVHDTPCILSEILHCKPWLRRSRRNGKFQKFIDDKWIDIVSAEDQLKITKIEAQTWFCFRQLLLNQNIMQKYTINNFRYNQLAKCQLLLNEQLFDQLPPLVDLKHYLCTLTISGSGGGGKDVGSTILLEELPVLKVNILSEIKSIGFSNIIKNHKELFLTINQNEIIQLAKRLNTTYGADWLEDENDSSGEQNPVDDKSQNGMTSSINKCGQCYSDAIKKCSKCQLVFYCCRECQVKHWPVHKLDCSKH